MTMGKLDWIPKLFDLHQDLVTDYAVVEEERDQAKRERDNLDRIRLRVIGERDSVETVLTSVRQEREAFQQQFKDWQPERAVFSRTR